MLPPGTFLGRYEIRSLLGKGGRGEVYLAHDRNLARFVSLKTLCGTASAQPEAQVELLQEARAAAALSHPNIVTIHEIGEYDAGSYIATEFIDGQTLRTRLSEAPYLF